MEEFATYKIGLWINNEESLYDGAREVTAYDIRNGNVYDAGTALSDYFETACNEDTVNDFAWTILSDLLGSVDWSAIAESLWGDEIPPGDDDDEWEDDDFADDNAREYLSV